METGREDQSTNAKKGRWIVSNLKKTNLAIVAVAAGVVILLSTETAQAGGFSVRVGGIGFGSWNTRCVERSYIYVNDDYDDDDYYSYRPVYREYYRPTYRVHYRSHYRPHYRPYHHGYRPYYSSRRHHTPYYRGHVGRRSR